MNKINLKNKRPEEFTPWEESFIDLANTFHKNQANNPPRRLYLSIDQKAHHCHRYHDNIQRPNQEQSRKPVLNTSKVNLLKNNNYKEMPYMIRNESKRFEGPRLTFYSKMNPKCNDHSRDKFKNNQRSEEKQMFSSNNFNKTMFRDESIKYLNIIEQKQKYEQRTHVEKGNEYEGNSNLTAYLKMIFLGKEKGELMNVRKKDDEHNSTMKRLKLLYNQKRYTSIMH